MRRVIFYRFYLNKVIQNKRNEILVLFERIAKIQYYLADNIKMKSRKIWTVIYSYFIEMFRVCP